MALAENGCLTAPEWCPSRSPCFPTTLNQGPSLPKDFPRSLNSPLAWQGSQFMGDSDYVLRLGSSDLQEVRDALCSFKELGLDGDLVSRDNFILPTLAKELEKMQYNVYQGRGFGLIRGLNPGEFSVEDLTTIYLGIQSYIANRQGRQDNKGNMMVHIVADNSTRMKATHHRHSTSEIAFHHEEAGDLVSWLTRNAAAVGGKCIIASSYTVYNALVSTRPDLIRALVRSDWPFALPHFHCRPVLFHKEGNVIMNFGRAALLGSASHTRPAGLPQLTPTQIEALDAIEVIARATQLEIPTQAGDIHFINNLVMLHRREAFVDGDSSTEKRHLVRMRLRDDTMGWTIPKELRDEWDKAFDPKLCRVWHLQPMPDGYFPLRSQSN